MADRRGDIDAWFDEQEREPDLPEVDVALDLDLRSPDEVAQERNIADEVGHPPQAVRAYPELFSRNAEVSRTQRAASGSPRLQRWLSSASNYAVARDDVDNLATVERMAGRPRAGLIMPFSGTDMVQGAIGLNARYRRGEAVTELSRLQDIEAQRHLGGGRISASLRNRARIQELREQLAQPEPEAPPVLGILAEQLPYMIGSTEASARAYGEYLGWFDRNRDRMSIGDVIAAGPESVIEAVRGGADYTAMIEAGNAFDEISQYRTVDGQPIDPAIAARAARDYGQFSAGVEVIGFGGVIEAARASGVLKNLGRRGLRDLLLRSALARMGVSVAGGYAVEGLEEATQETGQIAFGQRAQAEDGGNFQPLDIGEAGQRVLQSFLIGGVAGGAMAGAPHVPGVVRDLASISASHDAEVALEEWSASAQASRVGERLASARAAAVDAMTEGTPLAEVSIPVDAFVEHFQTLNKSPFAAAAEMGVSAEMMQVAINAHGVIAIPAGVFDTQVLRSPTNAPLARYARVAGAEFSPAELEDGRAQVEAIAKDVLERADRDMVSEAELGAMVEARMRELFAAAEEEGGYRPEIARRYAKLAAALPQTLVARARAVDPEYASRLEGQFRTLFGEGLDIAGPGRGAVGAGAELSQTDVNLNDSRLDQVAEGAKPLSPDERYAAAAAAAGYSNDEIATHLQANSVQSVAVLLSKAKKKLGQQLWSPRRMGRAPIVEPEKIARVRDQLRAQGVAERQITSRLAERFRMEYNAVYKALRRYDRAQKQRDAEQRGVRRTQPFDLHTAEGRAEWFAEEVLAEPIPGEASDARQYGFALDSGEIIVMSIAPEPTGSAAVEWTFLDRLKEQAAFPEREVDLFGPGKEKLGVRGVLAVMARVAAIMEADIAQFKRDSYVYTPNNDALEGIYKGMVNRILDGGLGYGTLEDGAGTAYLVRAGAKITRNGTVIASPENANAPKVEWPQVDPADIRTLQDQYYQRLERFAEEGPAGGDRGDGGQGDAAGGGAEAGRGVSGTGRSELKQDEDQPRLAALHNLTPDNLIQSARLGGLPVPSVGVVPEGQGLQDIGGSITLIGGQSIADPTTTPVYDADVWSPTFPQAEYSKVSSRKIAASAIYKALRKWDAYYGDEFRGAASALWDNAVNRGRPDDAINEARRASGAMAAYLEAIGETPPSPIMREKLMAHRAPWSRQPAWMEFVKNGDWERDNKAWDSPERRAFMREAGDAVRAAIGEYVNSKSYGDADAADAEAIRAFDKEALEERALNEDGTVSYGLLHDAKRGAETAGQQEADGYAIRDALQAQIGRRAAEFDQWLQAEIMDLFDAPFLRIGRKKAPFTLENVVQAMTGRVKAQQQHLTFGEGKARAAGARRFRTLEQMRKAAAKQIRSPEESAAAQAETSKLAEQWRNDLTRYYRYFREAPDQRAEFGATWESFDAAMRALSRVMAGAKTETNMRRALMREEFVDVPATLIQDGVDLAKAFIETPVPYFEAKPQRAVPLSEFSGAVIPSDASQAVRDVLDEAGVPYREYEKGDREAQARAAAAYTQELGALFQKEKGATRAYFETEYAPGTYPWNMRAFKPGEFGEAMIRMTEAADLSTFLHEFGHLSHYILESVATDPNAPAEFKSMWANTLSWWGVTPEEWAALDRAGRTPHLERWARTFEAYLMEGRAPSLSLREAFAAFKAWLTQIYRTVFALDANLNPQIRDVFDRMLATDAEMAEARAAMGADFALAREAFKTDEEYQAYSQALIEAREAEEAELRARVMDAYVRKEKRWWRSERARVRTTAEIEVDSDPARRAYEWLAFNDWRALPVEQNEDGVELPIDAALQMPEGLPDMKLDPRALMEDYGEGVFDELPVGLRPLRTEDLDAALDQAMALKRQARVKQPQRLWAFIKAQGGIKDEGGEITQALGSARSRPGLINNASGLSADELALRAWEAGYFGAKPRKGEAFQTEAPDAGRGGAGQSLDPMRAFRDIEDGKPWYAASADQEKYRRINRLMSRDRWLDVELPIDRLIATQRTVNPDFAEALNRWIPEGHGMPAVVKFEGRYYVTDGHHRLAARAARGERNARVRLFDGDGDTQTEFPLLDARPNERVRLSESDRALLAELFEPPPLRAHEGSWIGTSPTGEVREFFEQANAKKALEAGWTVETAGDYLGRLNRDIRSSNPPRTAPDGGLSPEEQARLEGGELFQDGELFSDDFTSDRRPTPRELLDALIDDLKNIRQVYSSDDADAVAAYQNRADAVRWFEARGIDLSGTKEEIRSQLVDALTKEAEEAGGWHPDEVAPWFGFSSGDEMIQAMKALKPRNVAIEENIEARLEGQYGDPMRDGTVAEAARLAAHVEAQANKIELELAAIQRATGGRATPVGRAAKAYAEQQIQRMTVKQVRNFDQFLAGERRAARNSLEAFKKGDMAQAALMKQRQLISFHLYRLARNAAEEMDKAQRYFQKFDRDTVRANIHPPLVDQIDQALEGIDLRRTPRLSNRKRQSFLQWYDEMRAEGLDHMVAVDPEFLAQAKQRPFASLTLEEARGIRDAVRNFEHIGRRWREVISARDKRLMEETVTEMVRTIEANGEIIKERRKGFSPDALEYLNERRLQFHAEHTKPEFLFRLLDGLKDAGPVWQNMFAPIARAEDAEIEMRNAAARRMTDIFAAYTSRERAKLFTKRIYVTAIGRSMTKAEILAVALNWGNEGNRTALMQGYQWNEAQVERILDELDERDWRVVQDIWAWIGEYRAPSFALQERLTGVAPAAVEGVPVRTNFGEIEGAYYPLRYDPQQGERAFRREEQSKTLEEWGSNWVRPQTRQGHLQARVGSGGQKVRLDLGVLTEHVENVIHDISHREAVIGTLRFIEHPRMQEAIIGAVGRQQYRQLRPWLSRIAADVKDPSSVWERVLLRLRMGASVVNMGYKVTTAIVQPLGLLNALPRVGGGPMTKALLDFYANPMKMRDTLGFVFERSAFMKNRMATFDRDVRDALNRIRGRAERDPIPFGVRQSFFWMTGVMDMSVSVPTWMAAYDSAIAGKIENITANDEKAAAEHADSVVRMTQGAGGVKDLTGYTGSKREIMRLFTMFYSYMANLYNQLYVEQAPGVRGGQIQLPIFAGNMMALWFLPAVGAIMLQGRWGGDDDETDEERLLRIGGEVASYPLATMVGVRDIVNGVVTPYDYTLTPVNEAFERTVGAAKRITGSLDDGEIDADETRAIMKDMTMAAGYWLALPARQLWITGEALTDIATGEDDLSDPGDTAGELFMRDRR